MVTCKYQKRGISLNHIWFAQKVEDIEKKDAVISYIHGVSQRPIKERGLIKQEYSLITDLKETEEVLNHNIKKNFRYEIRRAAKENVTVRVITAEEMEQEEELLQIFVKTYNQMYVDKGMNCTFNLPLVKAYMKNHMIIFTVAYYKLEPLVFHSYIVGECQCRFFYSTSPFRTEKELASMIGRMNKFLHWQDILWFKKNNYEIYDWGGITDPEKQNGIDNFKFGFGGELVSNYSVICGKNFLINALISIYMKKVVGSWE